MKLIFNPYYDQTPCTGNQEGCSMDKKYVGPLGLLSELELRSGLSRLYPGQSSRLLGYCEALGQYGQNFPQPDTLFYWKSFCADMLSTSRRLLQWRDSLVYARVKHMGSVPEGVSEGARDIISTLLDVEEYFNDESSAGDRWDRLSKEEGYLPSDWVIEVRMKEDLVDPVILDCLKRSGAKCTFVSELPKVNHAVRMLKFSNLVDGYQWAMTQDNAKEHIYINKDNISLNAVLDALGEANVSAEASGVYTRISQLFSSGMKLFISPVDYDALVSYLSVPVHPLNEYQTAGKSLRWSLLKHLQSQGGFGMDDKSGQDWNSIVAQSQPYDGNEDAFPLEYALGQWKKTASLTEIEKYCAAWSAWCAGKAASAKDISVRQQLQTIKENFDVFPKFLKLTGKQSFNEVELLVNIAAAASDASYDTDFAATGSIEAVKDIKSIAEPCETAVWMDCYDQGMPGYEYSFLNASDIRALNDAGMVIPLYESQLQADAVTRHLAYANITKQLTILTPEKVEGRKCYPQHLPHWDGDAEDMTAWVPSGRFIPMAAPRTQKMTYEVDSDVFAGLKKLRKDGGMRRDKESFSSLNMLIQNPFDYVMQYLLGCSESGKANLSSVKGNVVHRLFDKAVTASKDWSGIKKALKDDFDVNFEESLNEVGVELLSIENKLECTLFRNTVRETSIPGFIEFVEENNLEIAGSEVNILVEFEEIGSFEAKVDLVLKNSEGRYVIADLKWTDSQVKMRQDEIQNNTEMQLALYAEAVGRHYGAGDASCVAAVGYFMLRQGVFLTASDGFKDSGRVKVLKKDSSDSIYKMVKESYKFRLAQLLVEDGKSVIEEGEMMPVDEYLADGYLAGEKKFPLKGIKRNKNDDGWTGAKEFTYNRNVVLKGMLD